MKPGGGWKPIVYFTVPIVEIGKHASVNYSWHEARRKHNSAHQRALWRVSTGLLCFPISPRISFLSLISERISWRWNCALNMLQTRLNINESPALLFGCTGPIWIGFFAHWTNQTTHAVIRRCDSHPPVCTVRRLRPRSLNVAQSPLSSLFMFRGNPPQINNTSPQSPRLLMRRDSFSTRSWTLLQEDKECWRLGNTEYITAYACV